MANKIISISDDTTQNLLSASSDVIYKDVSMIADRRRFLHHRKKYADFALEYDLQDESEIDKCLVQEEDQSFILTVKSNVDPTSISDEYYQDFVIDDLVDIEAVQNSLHNIFTWIPGQRILNPEFGNKLYQHLYNAITTFNVESIIAEIRNCFSTWEPRANLVKAIDVSDTSDSENNTVKLQIQYTIPSLKSEKYRNRVFAYDYEYTSPKQ